MSFSASKGESSTEGWDPYYGIRAPAISGVSSWLNKLLAGEGPGGYEFGKFDPEGIEEYYQMTPEEEMARGYVSDLGEAGYKTEEDIARGERGLGIVGKTAEDWMRPEETQRAEDYLFGRAPSLGTGRGTGPVELDTPGAIMSSFTDPLEYVKPTTEGGRAAMEEGLAQTMEDLTAEAGRQKDLTRAQLDYDASMQQAGMAPSIAGLTQAGLQDVNYMFGPQYFGEASQQAAGYYDLPQSLAQGLAEALGRFEGGWRGIEAGLMGTQQALAFAPPMLTESESETRSK